MESHRTGALINKKREMQREKSFRIAMTVEKEERNAKVSKVWFYRMTKRKLVSFLFFTGKADRLLTTSELIVQLLFLPYSPPFDLYKDKHQTE